MSVVEAHGFVLAGGLSRRMGTDKARIVHRGSSLLDRAIRTLSDCREVTVIHREASVTSSVEVISDRRGGQGPLDGILTALEYSRHEVVVVLAVDLVNVTRTRIVDLVRVLGDDGQVAALCGDETQLLASAWRRSSARPLIADAFEAGERSIHALRDRLDIRSVEVSRSELHNANSPADLSDE